MLALLFHIGNDRYALDTSQVEEIVPLVGLRQVPAAPPFIAGLCNYRGEVVPIIDLSELIQGRPCSKYLSTRIVFVAYPTGTQSQTLGLIAERVTETLKVEDSALIEAPIRVEAGSFLGRIFKQDEELIQVFRVEQLLTEPVRKMLLVESEVSPGDAANS